LTGALDDGTAGMRSIKTRGGVAVVQEPAEALYPSMPMSVIRHIRVDHRLPLADIPPLLARLARERAAKEGDYPVPDELKLEAEIAEQNLEPSEMLERVEQLGALTSLTCPECHGSLWELKHGEPMRFRCHVGHAFSADSLVAEQSEELENALWSAQRALEEKMALMRRMAGRARERQLSKAVTTFEARAREAEQHAEVLRQILLNGREHAEAEVAGVD
jgi:two-component system chemotaxis response regulator CheB